MKSGDTIVVNGGVSEGEDEHDRDSESDAGHDEAGELQGYVNPYNNGDYDWDDRGSEASGVILAGGEDDPGSEDEDADGKVVVGEEVAEDDAAEGDTADTRRTRDESIVTKKAGTR